MLDYNLDYLKVYYFVCKHKNMTKAGEILFLSQPSVSRSIMELEKALDTKLIIRQSRGIKLTYEGEQFYNFVEKAIGHIMNGELTLSKLKQGLHGDLSIGATETPFYYLLPKMAKFEKEMAHTIHFQIDGKTTQDLIEQVRSNKLQLAFVVSPILEENIEDLQVIDLIDIHDMIIGGKDFYTLSTKINALSDLSSYPFVTVPQPASARYHVDKWFNHHDLQLRPAYTVQNSSTILAFVRQNMGLGIIPESIFNEFRTDDIFHIQTKEALPTRKIHLIHKKETIFSETEKAFIDYILKSI